MAVSAKEKSILNACFKAVQLKKSQRVQWMQDATVKRWEDGGSLDKSIKEYYSKVCELGAGVWVAGEARNWAVGEGNKLMKQAEEALMAAQTEVSNKLPLAGGNFHHNATPDSVLHRRKWKTLHRLYQNTLINTNCPSVLLMLIYVEILLVTLPHQ